MTYEEYKKQYNKEWKIMGSPSVYGEDRCNEAFINICNLTKSNYEYETMRIENK